MSYWLKLIIALVLPQLAGLGGVLFTDTGQSSWYQGLEKPAWNPPGWVFGPVWTILYILMGIAFYLVWKNETAPKEQKRPAMVFWVIQLVLNFFWTIIFFGAHSPGYAFIEIMVLWLAIVITIILFSRVNKTAAWLMVPYLLWVSFASFLNYTIYQMNSL